MAKGTTYTVTDPNGTTHKRTTQNRTYTHAVLYRASYERDMAYADSDHAVDGDNWEFAGRMVAWGGVYGGQHNRREYHTDEEIAGQVAKYTALRDAATDRADAIAQARAKRVATVHQRRTDGYYDLYRVEGWCGRIDLAQKSAAKMQGRGFKDVLILEAVKGA